MNKAIVLALSAVCAMAVSCAAGAAGDPWLGTWHKHGKNGAPDTTLTITPAAGGYTFVRKDGDAPVAITVAVIPDGRPHPMKGAMGPMTSTCHHTDVRSIACELSMSGLDSDATYSMSADGKSLTDSETDPEPPGHPGAYTSHTVLQKE